MKITTALISLTFAIVSGCATTSGTDPNSTGSEESATDRLARNTEDGLPDAALTPLSDLNLKRTKIPATLKAIKNPYNVDPDISCAQIAIEVEELNGILGRDWDVPPPDKKKLKEQAADGASTALLDAIASGAGGFIPYRGVVRQISGASSHQKKVIKAFERGGHRRTFLKGLGLLKGCDSPAAPTPAPKTDPKVVFK